MGNAMGNANCSSGQCAGNCSQALEGLRQRGPVAALRVVVMPKVSASSSGARHTGFELDDEVAVQRMEVVPGLEPLSWRRNFSVAAGMGSSLDEADILAARKGYSRASSSSPPWLTAELSQQRRHSWRTRILACHPERPDEFVEHQCLMQVPVDPEMRTVESFAQDLKDACVASSYAHQFNLQLTRLRALKELQERNNADVTKIEVGVQVCVPVICEVLGSSMPHFVSTGDFVLVSLLESEQVRKFVFNGEEPFEEMPQAFFHFVASTSSGKELCWDLQGYREPRSGITLLTSPSVKELPAASVGDLFSSVAPGAVPSPGLKLAQQFNVLHPRCTAVCEAFDPDRKGALGKGTFSVCMC
eukprot:TRINITY_DN89973_c0_g1_i1.p1 TRINITY_DN89973_c0_g1~~TRINITY_DN89973_c0_g1_i1.p1  ORF type:complete len:374 (-),score=65.63 TRINITY_DN89973_c0_g1_i1:49-1125(-)